MIDVRAIQDLAAKYDVPFEDVLFMSLNISGVDFECGYDRMRTQLRLNNNQLFEYAIKKGDLDYYLAMPVLHTSPFKIRHEQLFLGADKIGETFGATEDQCNSHYVRRNATAININTNLRTNCRGCKFCYTAYQVSNGEYRLTSVEDFNNFFDGIMVKYSLNDLASIHQLSVVTGCYSKTDELVESLVNMKASATSYGFKGRIFYLGSQLADPTVLESLRDIKPFGLTFSVEVFERRDILRRNKRAISLSQVKETLIAAKELGFNASIAYVLGLEPLDVVEKYFTMFKDYTNKFPTINTLQVHRQQLNTGLEVDGADRLEYYLRARKSLEKIFKDTAMRPLVWENYRGLWFLKFADEELFGCRSPEPPTSF